MGIFESLGMETGFGMMSQWMFYITYMLVLIGVGLAAIYYMKLFKQFTTKIIVFDKKKTGQINIIWDRVRKLKNENTKEEGFIYRAWKIKKDIPAIEDSREAFSFPTPRGNVDLLFYMKVGDDDFRPITMIEDFSENIKLDILEFKKFKKTIKLPDNKKRFKELIDNLMKKTRASVMTPIPMDMIFWHRQKSKAIIERGIQKDKLLALINATTPFVMIILVFILCWLLIERIHDYQNLIQSAPQMCKTWAQTLG